MDQRDRREEGAEGPFRVCRATLPHAVWTEAERGEPGAFTLQLILGLGAVGYV
jgi:hypothetical protein